MMNSSSARSLIAALAVGLLGGGALIVGAVMMESWAQAVVPPLPCPLEVAGVGVCDHRVYAVTEE